MSTIELPDEIVVLKARLNLEAQRHLHSITIIESLMPENQRAVLLPGHPAVKKDVNAIIEATNSAREEMSRREVQTMVRGSKPEKV